jgi:hypothetical protein
MATAWCQASLSPIGCLGSHILYMTPGRMATHFFQPSELELKSIVCLFCCNNVRLNLSQISLKMDKCPFCLNFYKKHWSPCVHQPFTKGTPTRDFLTLVFHYSNTHRVLLHILKFFRWFKNSTLKVISSSCERHHRSWVTEHSTKLQEGHVNLIVSFKGTVSQETWAS